MITLNEYGLAAWKHKYSKTLFAERTYFWVDRLVIIDESEGREIVDDVLFSTFDFKDWIPITLDQNALAKQGYKDAFIRGN
jgi:hypothetical protein